MNDRVAQRLLSAWYGSICLVLIGLAFLPWAHWLGHARATEVTAYRATLSSWLVLGAPILAGAIVIGRVGGDRLSVVLVRWVNRVRDLPARPYVVTLTALVALSSAAFSRFLFAHNPHLVDTIAQLFQARIFAEGSLTAPAPPGIEFFGGQHLVADRARWFSQYPPGHPALLTLGIWTGVPWLTNAVLATLTVPLVYGSARRLLGDGPAKLATLLYSLSPFVLFMGASFMSHVSTGFFLALALYGALRSVEPEEGFRWPLITGLALGLAATIRPLESAAWATLLGLWLLLRGGVARAALTAMACAVGVVPLLLYNAATTGHALRFGYTLLWGSGHGLGFHADPWGEPFTPLKSLAMTSLDFQRLNAFLFEWPYPSLLFLVALLALVAVDPASRRRGLSLVTGLLIAAPAAYFFYWHRDNFLGPRFLYPSVIPAILLTTAGIVVLDDRAGRWQGALRLTILVGALVGITLNLPSSAGVIAGGMPGLKLHPERQLEQTDVAKALVFVKVGWGNRLIARLWSWGVPAAETEQNFRGVDACRLQLALDQADSLAAVGVDSSRVRASLRRQLQGWRARDLPLVSDRWPDRSVRFDTTAALAEPCRAEIATDAEGYTLFGPLIWRNDPWLRDGVLYARSFDAQRNQRLVRRFSDREIYLYAPLTGEPGARPVLRSFTVGPAAGPMGDRRRETGGTGDSE